MYVMAYRVLLKKDWTKQLRVRWHKRTSENITTALVCCAFSVFSDIASRSMGSITGSRMAGMAARVLVEHVCCERSLTWRKWGFPTPSGVLTVSTYLHNLFAASTSSYFACKILDDTAEFLN